mmetsp:Transcript_54732/g.140971  ORF Transcript_54732/g.140971 Transcript_54732/m.140971 type:complete len:249 (+) Transcript_54732:532-1278(+)
MLESARGPSAFSRTSGQPSGTVPTRPIRTTDFARTHSSTDFSGSARSVSVFPSASAGTYSTLPSPAKGPEGALPAVACSSHRSQNTSGSQNSQRSIATSGQPTSPRPNTSSLRMTGGFSVTCSRSPSISKCAARRSAAATSSVSGIRAPLASTRTQTMASLLGATTSGCVPRLVTGATAFFFSFRARLRSPPEPTCLLQLRASLTRKRSKGSSLSRSRLSSAPRHWTWIDTFGSSSNRRTVASIAALA